MSNLVEPNLTAGRRRQLRVLEYLYDAHGKSSGSETPISPLSDEFGERGLVQDAVRQLVGARLVQAFESMAGYSGAILSSAGADVVEEARRLRAQRSGRNQALRPALLQWLYDQGIESSPVLTKFLDSADNQFYGAPFEESELHAASRWLHDEGYISGSGTLQGGIIRPKLTSKGVRAVEQGEDVNRGPKASGATYFNTHVYGPASNVAVASKDFSQTSNTNNQAAAAEVLAAVHEVLDVLAANDPVRRAELRGALREAEAAGSADPHLIHRVLTKVRDTVASGTAGAIGGVIVARIEAVLEMLTVA